MFRTIDSHLVFLSRISGLIRLNVISQIGAYLWPHFSRTIAPHPHYSQNVQVFVQRSVKSVSEPGIRHQRIEIVGDGRIIMNVDHTGTHFIHNDSIKRDFDVTVQFVFQSLHGDSRVSVYALHRANGARLAGYPVSQLRVR